MLEIYFLSIEQVIQINADQTRLFGGLHGVRDLALLDSAVNRPKAQFHGEFLHKDIFVMAAAYAHGIIQNHPFIDGNKRTGSLTALVFLLRNGYFVHMTNDELVEMSVATATSKISLQEIATKLRKATSAN